MRRIKNEKKSFKNKIKKYLLIGGFSFFLIKGIIWLIIFMIVGFNLISINN